MALVEYLGESLRITIPEEARMSGKVQLALRVGIPLSARELVATVASDDLAEMEKLNPKWVFSEGFGTIYSYVSATEGPSILILRRLNLPSNSKTIEVSLTRWRPQTEFTLEDAILSVYITHEDNGVLIYEEVK